jgi:GntR family transcriptional repressor for pyruvate dehydrogenase complex
MIVEVREGLEAKAARLAAERATRQDMERLAVFRQMQEIEVTDVERVTDLDLEFHDAVACASHNELLCRVMSSLQNILRQYVALSNQMTHELDTTIAEHQAIYTAIAAGDPDAAEQAMMDHLAISKTWILKAVARKSQALKVG